MDSNFQTRPLAYQSLKYVLQYMPADKRIFLAQRCPSIRTAERSTHLKIADLELLPLEFRIDKTQFKVELLNKTKNGHKFSDSDPHGFEIFNASQDMEISGEVAMTHLRIPEHPMVESIEVLADKLEKYIVKLGNPVEYLKEVKNPGERNFINQMVVNIVCQRYNIPPPFNLYIQLTILSGNEKYVERVLYGQKTGFDAIKYIFFKVFKGRRSVSAKLLTMDLKGPFRFPLNQNIVVSKLIIKWGCPQNLTPIESLIDLSKLQVITIKGSGPYNHPLILRASHMIHDDDITITDVSFFHHGRMSFTVNSLQKSQIMEFVRDWKENGRPIGTLYSFWIWKKWDVPVWFEEWKEFYGVGVAMKPSYKVPERLTIPMSRNSTIDMYVCEQEPSKPWILNLEVCRK